MTIPQIKAMLDKADEQEYQALERALSADTRKGVKSALAKAKKRLDGERKERERLESLYVFENKSTLKRDLRLPRLSKSRLLPGQLPTFRLTISIGME